MANSKTTFIIVGIIIVVLVIGGGKLSLGQDGAKPTEFSFGEGDAKNAITLHFADEDFNELEIQSRTAEQFSTVEFEGGLPTSGIFFMRFDVDIVNQGTLTKTISISDIKIVDANEVSVEASIIRSAFSCIINKPKSVLPSDIATWNTDPDDPTTGCSSLAWLPTFILEDDLQPLKIVVDIKSEFSLFGISREAITKKEFTISITEDTGGFGNVLVNLRSGSTGFLEECDGALPETEICPAGDVVGSVCEGIIQTCTVDGLWPGCADVVYGPDYTPAKESNGNALNDFTVTCKDGLDNDCDGTFDKPDVDGGCTSGNCDFDCPFAVVDFRTNADFIGGESISDLEQQGIWISVLRDTEEALLKSYGYIRTTSVTGVQCTTLVPGASGAGANTQTPTGNFFVVFGTNKINIHYDDDGNPTNGCFRMEYSNSDIDRCKIGDTFYPACISRFPVSTPFGLNLQETRVAY